MPAAVPTSSHRPRREGHPRPPSWLLGRLCAPVAGALLALASGASSQAPRDTAVVAIEGLEVLVASRLAAGARGQSIEVLTAERISHLPVRSVSEALNWALGVDLRPRSAAQADLSLRGSSFEQVLVLVDGVRVSDSQTGHFDMDVAVPLESVERIEVLRGPASAVHGPDALGGVVNIVMREGGVGPSATLRLEGGSFGGLAGAAAAGAAVGGWRVSGAAEHDRADGHRSGIDHRVTMVQASVQKAVGGGSLGVDVGWAARDFGADGFYAAFPSYEETRVRTLAASWRGRLGASAEIDVGGSARRHEDDFVLRRGDPAFYQNVHTSDQIGADASVRWVPAADWGVLLGAEAGKDDIESTNLGVRSERHTAAFGEIAWSGDDVGARGSLRLDGREGFSSALSPALSAFAEVGSRVTVRGALGWAHRTPTWTDRFYQGADNRGRADLESERGWSVEAGADLALAGQAVLRGTLFRRQTEDLIDWARPAGSPATTAWEARQVESAVFQGVEVSADGVRAASLVLWGSVELLDLEVGAEKESGMISKYALRPLDRSARLGARHPLPLDGIVSAQLRHHRRIGDEAYTLFDVRVEAPFAGGDVYVDLTNLGDCQYLDVSVKPAQGRALRVGIRLRG